MRVPTDHRNDRLGPCASRLLPAADAVGVTLRSPRETFAGQHGEKVVEGFQLSHSPSRYRETMANELSRERVDPSTRRRRLVAELRDLIQRSQYDVSARAVAESMLHPHMDTGRVFGGTTELLRGSWNVHAVEKKRTKGAVPRRPETLQTTARLMQRLRRLPLGFLLVTVVACGGDHPASTVEEIDPALPPVETGTWYRPGVATTWKWQLLGVVNTTHDVDVYDIDLFDVPASLIAELHADGRRVICYFSAGSYEEFRPDANRFLPAERGKTLDGFPDEQWLDIRSANVLAVLRDRLDLAVQKQCDGVEPDNIDGYTNDTGFPLTEADQLRFNRTIANEAHTRGLAVGLKNDLDQLAGLVRYVDFAVNEQCHEFEECDTYGGFIAAGKPVFNAEYESRLVQDANSRAAVCAASRGLNIRTLILPLDLDDAFRFSCDP